MSFEVVLISACLLDIPCRYNGQASEVSLISLLQSRKNWCLIPVCPEQLGGLPTPRHPVEIQQGDGFDVLKGKATVETHDGRDMTCHFVRGAEIVFRIATLTGAGKMITQARSPSCSSHLIYDGRFSNRLIEGYGVCAALLEQRGMELIDCKVMDPGKQTDLC
jgi:uncharacterized protein YbbK (DUF523 family)